MSIIERLRERQKKLESARRSINAKIKKAELLEKKQCYENAAREMEQVFKVDPSCGGSKIMAGICAKYFERPIVPIENKIVASSSTASDSSKDENEKPIKLASGMR
jgi:hypothetical protein